MTTFHLNSIVSLFVQTLGFIMNFLQVAMGDWMKADKTKRFSAIQLRAIDLSISAIYLS